MPVSRETFLAALGDRAERIGEWLLSEADESTVSLGRLRATARAYVERPGKRLRPALLLFACAAVGGDEEQALPAAAAVELFHTWSLVHDDIIDQDDLRRGLPTAHRVAATLAGEELGLGAQAASHYGQSAAILAGDLLLAKALRLVLRCREKNVPPDVVLDLADRMAGTLAPELVDGEMLDVEFSHRPLGTVGEDAILQMLERKTGALLGYAAAAGACIGRGRAYADCAEARSLDAFARACGIAFQLQDDILGLVGDERRLGKPIGSDLREGKATLPLLHALRNTSPAEREWLEQTVGNPQATPGELAAASARIREAGGIDHARNLAGAYLETARNHLEPLPDTPAKALLDAWAGFLFDRDF